MFCNNTLIIMEVHLSLTKKVVQVSRLKITHCIYFNSNFRPYQITVFTLTQKHIIYIFITCLKVRCVGERVTKKVVDFYTASTKTLTWICNPIIKYMH